MSRDYISSQRHGSSSGAQLYYAGHKRFRIASSDPLDHRQCDIMCGTFFIIFHALGFDPRSLSLSFPNRSVRFAGRASYIKLLGPSDKCFLVENGIIKNKLKDRISLGVVGPKKPTHKLRTRDKESENIKSTGMMRDTEYQINKCGHTHQTINHRHLHPCNLQPPCPGSHPHHV